MAQCKPSEVVCWIIALIVLLLVMCIGCVEFNRGARSSYADAKLSKKGSSQNTTKAKAASAKYASAKLTAPSPDTFSNLFMKQDEEAFLKNKGVGFTRSWQDSSGRENCAEESTLMANYSWNPPSEDTTAQNIQDMKAPSKASAYKAANTNAFSGCKIRSSDGLAARSKGLDPMAFARPAVRVVLNQKPVSFLDSEARQNVVMSMTDCAMEDGEGKKACAFSDC